MLTALQKTSSPAFETGSDYDIDTSPPYSPTPSEMERPSIHPQIIFDLRQACAIVVNETNPPDPDEEPDHRETMRKFEEQRTAKLAAQARAAKAADLKAQKADLKVYKPKTRSEQRADEKAQKDYARQVEADTRRVKARDAEQERRKVLERQADIRMGQANAPQEQPKKEQPRRYSARRPPEDVPSFGPRSDQRTQVTQVAVANLERHMSQPKHMETYRPTMEPLEPTHTKLSSKAQGKQKEVEPPRQRQLSESRSATKLEFLPPVHATIVENTGRSRREPEQPALDHIRASIHDRPKTSAAATVDYDGPSAGSSKSTTRSNTEYDNHRPTSTAVTSAVLTPGDDKRISYNRQLSVDSYRGRQSNDSYQGEEVSSPARDWQAYKEALRRAEEKHNKSGRAARPGSKASKRSRRWGGDGDSDYERPLSRAGSLSESIRSGISNYIRPRASQDSMRSGRSSASGFRPQSRSSSVNRRSSSGWWKGAGLRRKGSWSSFRSMRPENDEPSKLRKNGEPNLNRPLPALPGLDQYKETKTHIGQLLKPGARGRKKEKTPRPDPSAAYPLSQQQPQPQSRHVRKESISNPVLRNSSMERTLHRYRESQLLHEDAPRAASSLSIRRNDSPQRRSVHPEPARKDSTASLAGRRSTNNNSRTENPSRLDNHSRQENYSRQENHSCADNPSRQDNHSRQGDYPRSHSRQTIERSLSRNDTTSPTSLISPKLRRGSSTSEKYYFPKSPPPMIRGPSYQKELEEAVYPRPMDVNKGGVVDVSKSGMYNNAQEVTTPSTTLLEGLSPLSPRSPKKNKKMRHANTTGAMGTGFGVAETPAGEWERKGGLRGRVGRMFGGGNARVVDHTRRAVAA